MTVSNTASTASFTLNQTTATFTFTFRALTSTPTDIKAIITTNSTNQNLTYTTDYTVAVNSDGVGGVLTLVTPATKSKGTLTVYRSTTNTQASDYDDYNQFPADTLETDVDKRTLVSQEQAESLTRALLLPITVTGVSTTLPIPVAGKVIGWSTGALSLCNYDTSASDVTAAASSATAALSSQSLASLYASTASTQALLSASSATTALNASMTTGTGTFVLKDGTVNPTNLLSNGDFEVWSAGAAADPDGWTLVGTGAAVAREGTIYKMGTYSAKVTKTDQDCTIYARIDLPRKIAYWKGRTITMGCWVYATVANRARLQLADTAVTTSSSYHTGDSTWQWLTVTHTVDSSGVVITALCSVSNGNTDAYFDGAICVEGESAFAFADKPTIYSDTRYKIGTFTRDMTAEGGDVAYTSVGFTPKAITFFGGVDNSLISCYNGYDDGTVHYNLYNQSGSATAGQTGISASGSIYLVQSGTQDQYALVKSFDADGFTLTWAKSGTPSSGTATLVYMAYR